MLCYPRILGFVFNPLSVFFCYDDDEQLSAIIHEVNNTFGQRHSYVIPQTCGDPRSLLRHSVEKKFYVSPFIAVQGNYRFRIVPPAERMAIAIRHTQQDRGLLYASFEGKRIALGNFSAISEGLRSPLMTIKVVAAIHWEALRLWIKGIPLVSRPAPPLSTSTTGTPNFSPTSTEAKRIAQ